MTLTDAYNGFAINGDAIKSQGKNNKYSRGRWGTSGNVLTTLEPGQGYIYTSNETDDRELTYPSGSSKVTRGNGQKASFKNFKTKDISAIKVVKDVKMSVKDVKTANYNSMNKCIKKAIK